MAGRSHQLFLSLKKKKNKTAILSTLPTFEAEPPQPPQNMFFVGLFTFTWPALLLLLPCVGHSAGLCIPSERDALLRFKQGLTDPAGRLSSWKQEHDVDCCGWRGVVCHNSTGHVLQLRLRTTSPRDAYKFSPVKTDGGVMVDFNRSRETLPLGGKISPSLASLKHLHYLDLSGNAFGGIHIPTFLSSLSSLRYLNLSYGRFGGTVPHQLGNLSNLQSLDLGGNSGLSSDSLQWVSGLSSLQHLDLNHVDLNSATDWAQVTNTPPSLKRLYLSNCRVALDVSLPPAANYSSLSLLDLSESFLAYEESLIPEWIFGLRGLTHLYLSDNNIRGPIPVGLRNLTGLKELDLNFNHLNASIPRWVFDLTNLELLDLGGNSLQGRIPDAIRNMTSLVSLNLAYNGKLEGGELLIASLGNLCRLERVSFSGIKLGQDGFKALNSLSKCTPHGLVELSLEATQLIGQFRDLIDLLAPFKKLAKLVLSDNSLHGPIPMSIGELSSLKELHLDGNRLSGTIPEPIGRLLSLESLFVQNNQLSGTYPESLGQLISLQELKTSDNPMGGDVTEVHFANLTKLSRFEAFRNKLNLKVSSSWVPPFQLVFLFLDSWQVGPQFPRWLRSQRYLYNLQVSHAGIISPIPDWFWDSLPFCRYFNLSNNQIQGHINKIPSVFSGPTTIALQSNQISGSLPPISSNISGLDLSDNNLSGTISQFLCHKPEEQKQLEYLNLQNNLLSGQIPQCWMNWQSLDYINFENNKFSGSIPSSIGFLSSLQSLQLRNNNLQGELPNSLGNCSWLRFVDLGENYLVGKIPTWIGENFNSMKLLRLRSNKFYGRIPNQLCALTLLQVLDLANNNLSGPIPRCFNNFTAMTIDQNSNKTIDSTFSYTTISDNALVVTKGNTYEYSENLGYLTSIDLSNNNLGGKIPNELTSLVGLRSLNLSNNLLTGHIPETIGAMKLLESIDFSVNKLSGDIPSSMSNLAFLSVLNISENSLVGRIPSSTQLQSFDASSFVGNQLCGPPLPTNCSPPSSATDVETDQGKAKDAEKVDGIYVSMVIGFIMGFWFVSLPLFKKSWRLAYYGSLDNLRQRLCAIFFRKKDRVGKTRKTESFQIVLLLRRASSWVSLSLSM